MDRFYWFLYLLMLLGTLSIFLSCNQNNIQWVLNGEFIEKEPPKLIYVDTKDEATIIINEMDQKKAKADVKFWNAALHI